MGQQSKLINGLKWLLVIAFLVGAVELGIAIFHWMKDWNDTQVRVGYYVFSIISGLAGWQFSKLQRPVTEAPKFHVLEDIRKNGLFNTSELY